MAPIKVEDSMREKLEERRLKPSAEAWSRLDEKLEAQDEKKANRGFWWLGIAASTVGILVFMNLFFNQNTEHTTPIIVDSEAVNSNLIEKVTQKSVSKEVIVDFAVKDEVEIIEELNNKKTGVDNAPTKEKIDIKKKSTSKYVVAQTENTKQKQETLINEEVKKGQFNIGDQKKQKVAVETKAFTSGDSSVTDHEINALLGQAHQELIIEKSNTKNTKTVDVNALLQDVETDLDRSFRAKVFETLKTSYHTVKTAVAERND